MNGGPECEGCYMLHAYRADGGLWGVLYAQNAGFCPNKMVLAVLPGSIQSA